MGKSKGAKAVWAHHGSKSGLEPLLPGVKVHVLGPPDLTQSEKIRKQKSRDPDQFWHLVSGGAASNGKNLLSTGFAWGATGQSHRVPPEARWFRDRLERLNGQQLLEIVRTLDQQMNNTSLILLFEVFGKKLLFPATRRSRTGVTPSRMLLMRRRPERCSLKWTSTRSATTVA